MTPMVVFWVCMEVSRFPISFHTAFRTVSSRLSCKRRAPGIGTGVLASPSRPWATLRIGGFWGREEGDCGWL
jgi:hypothetical protein